VTLSVQNEEPAAEILILLASGSSSATATVNGQPAACELACQDGRLFAKVAVPQGASQVVAQASFGSATAAALEAPAANATRTTRSGGTGEAQPGHRRRQSGRRRVLEADRPRRADQPYNRDNHFDYKTLTKGATFRLNAGQAKGQIVFKFGEYTKTIPLDFTGWKDIVLPSGQFDNKPKTPWGVGTQIQFVLPAGSVYVSDFRLIPLAAGRARRARGRPEESRDSLRQRAAGLDGELNDEIWAKAVKLETADKQTTYYVAYDDKNLYVAARCLEGIVALPPKPPRNNHLCFHDPNIEIYLMPKGGRNAISSP